MLELPDGKKLVQTNAILNWVGSKYGLKPKDEMLIYKGEKALARFNEDYLSKYLIKAFHTKDENLKKELFREAYGAQHTNFMNDFTASCLGDSKFICGDTVTIYDLCIAGFYTNAVLNPNNEQTNGNIWKESWDNAPQRFKEYIEAF